MKKNHSASVWMVGTSPKGKGGIASVIQEYDNAALFESGAVRFEPSHHDRSIWGRIVPFLRCSMKLWGGLLSGRVTLIHAHTSHGASFWRKTVLILPAFVLNVPAIVHLHGSDLMEFYSRGTRWRRHWMRFLFRHSFRVIALSEEWKEWVRSVEPGAKVEVIFNSLPRQTGRGSRASFGPTPTVLFLGGIGKRKGAFDLLRAFAAVKATVPQARLVLAGNGDTERLLAEAEALDVRDAIDCVGWIDGEHKSRLMNECWVFALPSYREGLPMAIIEAMAFSRAIVSCPVGGIPHAVQHEQTGFLIQPGDVSELARSLSRILSNRDTAERLGRAGRLAFEKKFSHDTTLPQVLSLYRLAGVARLPQIRSPALHHGRPR